MSTSSLPSFIKIHQAVLEKKSKMWNVYGRQTDGRTDDGRCAMTIAHSSLRLRWAKKCTIEWIKTLEFTLCFPFYSKQLVSSLCRYESKFGDLQGHEASVVKTDNVAHVSGHIQELTIKWPMEFVLIQTRRNVMYFLFSTRLSWKMVQLVRSSGKERERKLRLIDEYLLV